MVAWMHGGWFTTVSGEIAGSLGAPIRAPEDGRRALIGCGRRPLVAEGRVNLDIMFLPGILNLFDMSVQVEDLKTDDFSDAEGFPLGDIGPGHGKSLVPGAGEGIHQFNHLAAAFNNYIEVLKIYKQLAEKNPGAFLQYVATTQNNLGVLYSDNNRFPEALQAYSEALKIYKQLAEKNPAAFLPYVAGTQNNLGILYASQNQLEQALEILTQAKTTLEQLTAQNPNAFEINLCGTMIVLAEFVHLPLAEKTKDLTHLEKAGSLLDDAIPRLVKYKGIPQAEKFLKDAQEIKKLIDEAKKAVGRR